MDEITWKYRKVMMGNTINKKINALYNDFGVRVTSATIGSRPNRDNWVRYTGQWRS